MAYRRSPHRRAPARLTGRPPGRPGTPLAPVRKEPCHGRPAGLPFGTRPAPCARRGPRRPARPARVHPSAGGRGQRGLVLQRPRRLSRRTGRLLAGRLRLARGRGRHQPPRALPGERRRCPGALPARTRARPPADPADPHPRLALDVLALVEGDRPARRSGRVRRRSRGRLRRHRAVPARLRLPRSAHRLPGRQLLEGLRPLAHPDDRDTGVREVRRRGL
ncbi:hypothetical protein SGPA1_40968 [Streptomyces misionensis JCM 4497]